MVPSSLCKVSRKLNWINFELQLAVMSQSISHTFSKACWWYRHMSCNPSTSLDFFFFCLISCFFLLIHGIFARQLLLSTVYFFQSSLSGDKKTPMSHPIVSWFLMVCCICLWRCLWIVQKDQKKAGNVSVVSGPDFDLWSCSHSGLLIFSWGMCHFIDSCLTIKANTLVIWK